MLIRRFTRIGNFPTINFKIIPLRQKLWANLLKFIINTSLLIKNIIIIQHNKTPLFNMEYKYLGPTGLKVSVIGLGSGVLTDDPAQHEGLKQVVKKAFESGINFFDTAEMYGYGQSELALGKAFKELDLPREQLVVSTKIFWGPGNGPNDNGLSRKHLIEGTKASLKRLQLDYVDLLFCHKPDYQTPVEETVRAIDFLIQKGWILYWGTSEWPVERIMEAHRICEKLGIQKPVVEQPEYNMLNRYKLEKEYLQLFNLEETCYVDLCNIEKEN